MYLNHRRAVVFAVIVSAAAATMLLLVGWDSTRPAVQRVDDRFLDWMVAVQVPPFTWVAKGLDLTGSVWVTAPVRVGAVVWLATRRRWAQAGAFLLAVASSEVAIGVLKTAYARPRPAGSLVDHSGWSFPSGHAVAGAVTAIALVMVVLPPGPRRWAWEVRAGCFAFVMALSRAYLGAHWLSDAVAGTLLGTALTFASVILVVGIRNRQRRNRALEASSAGRQDGVRPDAGAPNTGAVAGG